MLLILKISPSERINNGIVKESELLNLSLCVSVN